MWSVWPPHAVRVGPHWPHHRRAAATPPLSIFRAHAVPGPARSPHSVLQQARRGRKRGRRGAAARAASGDRVNKLWQVTAYRHGAGRSGCGAPGERAIACAPPTREHSPQCLPGQLAQPPCPRPVPRQLSSLPSSSACPAPGAALRWARGKSRGRRQYRAVTHCAAR